MTSKDHIALTERYGAHNYHPLPVVLSRGEGVWVGFCVWSPVDEFVQLAHEVVSARTRLMTRNVPVHRCPLRQIKFMAPPLVGTAAHTTLP